MTNLTPAQLRAVHSDAPNLVVIAVPGSGKTHTLVSRVARLVREGTAPSEIVCITFTNTAAREFTRRLARELGDEVQLGFVGTLHGWALRCLQRHGHLIGLPARLAVIDQDQDDQTLKRVIAEARYHGTLGDVRKSLAGLMRGQKSNRTPAPCELVARRYLQTLRAGGMLSFDLILSEFLRLIRASVAPLDVEHLMVDEFQDSGDLDAAIYAEVPALNRFVVGDPWQSIYGFRGGNVEHIEALRRSPAWETIELDTNFRSDEAICQAANRLAGRAMAANTLRVGEVMVRCFDTAAGEMSILADSLIVGQGSAAVLTRYNHHAELFRTFLAGMGVPIARRQATERPADWPVARAALALLADPANDWLAYWLLKAHGLDADRLRREAVASGSPLARLAGLEIADPDEKRAPGPALARLGVKAESIGLVELAAEQNPEAGPSELLILLNDPEDQPMSEGVHVGTVHSAKGMEFDRVFVPCFEEGLLPGKNVEEDRRLAYVAITRARHELWIGHARRRPAMFGPGETDQRPSRFLSEMGLNQ